jgi:hypothetical protein
VEDAVFADRDTHQLSLAFAIEASREVPAAGGIRLTDDLDRSHRLLADGHVDVMHDEVPARQHFVRVGADDGDLWLADHVAGRLPSSGDSVESLVGRTAFPHPMLLPSRGRARSVSML